MEKQIRTSIVLLSFFALVVFSTASFAQQQEIIKQQAEEELQRSTPDQVRAKIKELGLSEKEAEARAKAAGIDLQKYLGLPETQQDLQQQNLLQDQLQGAQDQLQDQQQDRQQDRQQDQKQRQPKIRKQLQPQYELRQQDSLELGIPQVVSMPSALAKILTVVPGFEGRSGVVGLQPFGYNLFQYPTSTFSPAINMPTPPTYILGPGDELLLTMWGETQLFSRLIINREGNIIVPNAGPVPSQGITVEALKARLLKRLTSFYSGLRNGTPDANTWLDISIGKLKTIQVFVLGEVKKPGGYAISSMSTSFLALYVAGGPSSNGSLRSIDVLRNSKTISTIDFYDYALRGDQSKDVRLQDGDVVFVKSIGKRTALTGNVIRPAVYELKSEETLKDLIVMGGGLQVDAYYDRAHVERIIPFSERKLYEKNILDLDLKFSSAEDLLKSSFILEDGDIVSILQINKFLQNRVFIAGNVKKPGIFAQTKGMKVRDLILEADSLLDDTFTGRADVVRVMSDLRKQILPFNLDLAMQGDLTNNLELESEDSVTVYKQDYFFPEQTVSIAGAVRKPGTYLRLEKMTVVDLVVKAGGLTEDASKTNWELARLDTLKIGALSKIIKFNVPEQYWDNQLGDVGVLKDFDHVMVPSNPKYNRQRVVEINGYVLYPGNYALQREGEKLASLIQRAGGLRQGAYLEGSTLVRKWNNAGLVPIDFMKALADTESLENVTLLASDVISIASKQEVVLVRGEVFVPAAVVFRKGASLSYYINQAGGFKDEADGDRTFVTLPNGRKWEKGWFVFPDQEILGGSLIVVPKKIEKEDTTLPVLRDWATIMASIATMLVGIIQITK